MCRAMLMTSPFTLAVVLLLAGGVTGNGQFKLGGLPAGNFTLKAWLDDKTMLEQPVSLKPGPTLRVELPGATLAAPR